MKVLYLFDSQNVLCYLAIEDSTNYFVDFNLLSFDGGKSHIISGVDELPNVVLAVFVGDEAD